MARLFFLFAILVLLASASVGTATGIATVSQPAAVADETHETPIASSLAPAELTFFSWTYWQEGGTSTSRSEVFRNFGLFFVAVIALGFGIWRAVTGYMQARASQRQAEAANEQARIAQQGHITERFSRAVEQLGHDRVAVRIGGLHALKRIAEDSVARDHLAVLDVFANFIRQPPYVDAQREAAEREKALRAFRTNSAKENAGADQIDRAVQIAGAAATAPAPELIDCPDIVAAISIVRGRGGNQKTIEDERGYRLSLSRANLSYLRLPEVNLMFFDLAGAHLRDAILTHSKLFYANLTGVDLTGADLTGADLTRASLSNANLTGANLTDSNLTDADLSEADLLNTNVTQEQLDSACISKGTPPPTLPEGLKPPQKVCVPRKR